MKKIILTLLFIASYLPAQATQIPQTIPLTKGWNAIFITISPPQPDPNLLFQNLPINQVFTYHPQKSSVQFIQEPDEIDIKQTGWSRWVPSDQPDAFLNSIFQILAGQAYLIHSTQDYTWTFTGKPIYKKHIWQPNSFNLKGFYVNPDQPPTFASYFEDSTAHSQTVVYSLMNNHWQQLTDLETNLIDSGKAYWIYSKGGSTFNGPLNIDLSTALKFNIENQTEKISFDNLTQNSLEITIEHINHHQCPFYLTDQRYYQPITTISKNILPKSKETINIGIRSGEISASLCESVLKVFDDAGSLFYIPMSYQRLKD
jgi:hypothetical protein